MTKEEKSIYNRQYRLTHLDQIKKREKVNYSKNREWYIKYNRQYRLDHPEYFKKKNREYFLSHQEENKIHCLEYAKKHRHESVKRAVAWAQEHRERRKEILKKYNSSSRGKLTKLLNVQKRRSRILSSCDGSITIETWLTLIEHFQWRCVYCGNTGKLTIDHVVPVSKGGPHSLRNIVPACRSCNISKGKKFLHEWKPQIYKEVKP